MGNFFLKKKIGNFFLKKKMGFFFPFFDEKKKIGKFFRSLNLMEGGGTVFVLVTQIFCATGTGNKTLREILKKATGEKKKKTVP